MTLKSAALLALIGSLLFTILMALDFIKAVSGFLGDVVPVISLLRSLVYLVASLSATIFFFVFHKAQSR
ncbi:MAG: hypothetical protein NTV52_18240 [Acidobacteria bacterium]|nr:hypothetical protein [Acidobacteriota bacterium]